jgi:serine/threonine-protein kinase RsbW
MGAVTTIKLVIPSEIRLVDMVHEVSQKMAELAGFEPDDALNLGLAVREAVINAVKHGNQEKAAREVEVEVRVEDHKEISVTVCDQGDGFDPDATPDPTDIENILMNSGRGILMIRAFVDDVQFRYREGRGMEVVLSKKLSPSGRAIESGP